MPIPNCLEFTWICWNLLESTLIHLNSTFFADFVNALRMDWKRDGQGWTEGGMEGRMDRRTPKVEEGKRIARASFLTARCWTCSYHGFPHWFLTITGVKSWGHWQWRRQGQQQGRLELLRKWLNIPASMNLEESFNYFEIFFCPLNYKKKPKK